MSGKLSSIQVFSITGGQNNALIGPNLHRTRLMITCQSAGVGIAVNTRIMTAKDDGLSLTAGVNGGILDLTLEDHGDVITKSWNCFPGAAANIGILEVIDGDPGIPGGSYQYAH